MAANSHPVDLGSQAPLFDLPDSFGQVVSLSSAAGQNGTLIIFMCNHCPYVIHMLDALIQYAQDYKAKGVQVIAINSNDALAYPADSPEHMRELQPKLGFPYLIDETQEVARAYDAACTPDLYLYDATLKLYYHGRFDASRPKGPPTAPPDGSDLRVATNNMLLSVAPSTNTYASIGCSIKWKP
jgi:peroxiredoxin